MAEAFDPAHLPTDKAARYFALSEEVAAVLEGETDETARMATVAAMVSAAFPEFLWTGFYRVDPAKAGELVVGPYQGTLGCLRIAFGDGVCGVVAARRESLIVADVGAFDGHIACDSRSRSEIVMPVIDASGALLGVLDIDSAHLAAFDEADERGLGAILRTVFAANAPQALRFTHEPAK
jgi:GAF domain-containing protein